MKFGLDDVNLEVFVYDVEEYLFVKMQLSGGISYYWECGVYVYMEVFNEIRIYGMWGGIKLVYCIWDDLEIIFYDLDENGKVC